MLKRFWQRRNTVFGKYGKGLPGIRTWSCINECQNMSFTVMWP